MLLDGFEKGACLLGCEWLDFVADDSRRIDQHCNVTRHKPPFQSLSQGLSQHCAQVLKCARR